MENRRCVNRHHPPATGDRCANFSASIRPPHNQTYKRIPTTAALLLEKFHQLLDSKFEISDNTIICVFLGDNRVLPGITHPGCLRRHKSEVRGRGRKATMANPPARVLIESHIPIYEMFKLLNV